ncbi:MAG TPA: transglycosylase domain-containing protein [Actinomycetota bacterium]|jgi:penicillin-binding protein 1A|nr:transglycosylase domain-containing protein [Actinomycetota bacterium]
MKTRRISLLTIALVLAFTTACGQLEPLSTREALERLSVATSKVYDARGNVIANLHGEINRDIASIEEIPRHVRDAVVAIEDVRFWQHQGLDLRSITRAAFANVRTGPDAPRLQGGSTLTQQLAKNLYFPRPERTIARKVAEAQVTWQLERQYTKQQILEMYLNTIYLGRGLYGFETAARSYFGKAASELTLPEAAFLAGLIHEPGRYTWAADDPPERIRERREAATARRNTVIARMRRLDMIGDGQMRDATASSLDVRPVGERQWKHPYFVDLVLRQLGVLRSQSAGLDPRFDFLGGTFDERSRNVYRGGLRIYTALDPRAQAGAEKAVATVLPKDLDRLSAALVAIEPRTGYIRALVGGRDYYPDCPPSTNGSAQTASPACSLGKVNLALGSYGGGSGRQPGSSFKPFVLAAALERGISLHQPYASDPFSYEYTGGVWKVSNYDGAGGGAMTVVDGTARSVNAVFARLEIDGVGEGDGIKGASYVAGVARRLGVEFPTRRELQVRCGDGYLKTNACLAADDTPAIALGAKEVAPINIASAYAAFANDGIRVEPTAIVRITDAKGRVLYRADPRELRAIPSGVARGITHALRQVVQRGTGTRASLDRPVAGKTGTSQQWRDAWFDGYVPQLAAAVWVGNPCPPPCAEIESMTPANGYPYRIVGGTLPAMIWRTFMTEALKGVPVRDFAPPPSVLFTGSAVAAPSPSPDVGDAGEFDGFVPDVIGDKNTRAETELRRAGYGSRSVQGCDRSGNYDAREVFAQDPAPGSAAEPGTIVTIVYQSRECEEQP